MRQRDASKLRPLTIHGHAMDEYHVMVHPDDTVQDLKYLVSPLVNNGSNAQNIQFNFNTVRRLEDSENVVAAGCLASNIVVMFWFEMENEAENESPI